MCNVRQDYMGQDVISFSIDFTMSCYRVGEQPVPAAMSCVHLYKTTSSLLQSTLMHKLASTLCLEVGRGEK